MKVSDAVESRISEFLGDYGGFVLVFVDKEADIYTITVQPIHDIPEEPFYPISRHVLLDADSAAFLDGAMLDWSYQTNSFYITLPDGAVNYGDEEASFTFH